MGKRRRRRFSLSRSSRPVEAPVAERVGASLQYTPAPPPAARTPLPSAPTVVPAKQSRLERRRAQRRRQRRMRFSAAGVLGVVGVVIAIVVAVGFATHHGKGKSAAPKRTQATLLLQIRGPNGGAVESALLAHDPKTHRGVVLLVPSQVIADLPGHGDASFGSAIAVGTPSLAQESLADLVGITVDGALVLDQASFARLVDRLGGITVDVDVDVLQSQRNGTQRVVVPKGPQQHLNGSAAVAFATYGQGGELVRLTRLETVLNGVLAKVSTANTFSQAVQALGTKAQSTMTAARMGPLVAGLAADAQAETVDYRTLDVNRIDVPGGTSYTLDRPKVRAFVQQSLAASIPAGLLSGGNTVLVKNGVGTPQLGRTTRSRLVNGGFAYVEGGNVPGFPFRTTRSHVLVFSTTPSAIARGGQVAKALGLPSTDVDFSRQGQSVADIIVLLGRDYRG